MIENKTDTSIEHTHDPFEIVLYLNSDSELFKGEIIKIPYDVSIRRKRYECYSLNVKMGTAPGPRQQRTY